MGHFNLSHSDRYVMVSVVVLILLSLRIDAIGLLFMCFITHIIFLFIYNLFIYCLLSISDLQEIFVYFGYQV